MNRTPRQAPGLIVREMDDGTVIVSPSQGEVRVLNETGSLLWSWINGDNSVDAISRLLAGRFDLDEDQASHDVLAFLATLDERGLLLWEDSTDQTSD